MKKKDLKKIIIMAFVSSIALVIVLTSCASTTNVTTVLAVPTDISIIVTDIPDKYHGTLANLSIITGSNLLTDIHIATGGCISLGLVTETKTFYMNSGTNGNPGYPRFNEAGHYALLLSFGVIDFDTLSVTTLGEYMIMGDIVTGDNEISYSLFSLSPLVRVSSENL
ncbi:MAG: hypothetical protein FWC91_14710 [Defluviitaleaceae bacterium]|nr:hypothetical protein [Defluviitaleaceae bacterium]